MDIVQVVVVALIRGLTEFLPVSSSGHLVITSQVLGWPDRGIAFDVAVHVGTLAAVLAYFWRDVGRMLYGLISPLWGRAGEETRLFWNVVIATLPLVLASFLLFEVEGGGSDILDVVLGSPVAIGAAIVVFAILLWLADALGPQAAQVRDLGPMGALFIGLAQVLALIPGTSRAGITITAARLLGIERDEAARFSFLLAIPAIAGAGVLIGRALTEGAGVAVSTDAIIGLAVSFVAALAAIALLLAWVRRGSYLPFVIYRILLGAILIYWFYDPAAVPGG